MEHPINIIFKPFKWENKDKKNGTSWCAINNRRPSSCKMDFGQAKSGSEHHISTTKNENG